MVVGVDLGLVRRTECVGAVGAGGQPRIDDTIGVFGQRARNTGMAMAAFLPLFRQVGLLTL